MKLRKPNLRKSTAALLAAWVATFALYVMVKPENAEQTAPASLLNAVPTWNNPDTGQ